MIIKSVKLNNIRSYLDENIEFPQGSVMLAGDIGSGKSTILLAIEFALFGVKRSYYSGGSLLRNGKKNGSVELKVNVDGKDIVVKRVLKRGKNEIKQEAGYVIVDDVKREGTAVELKSMILDILGYPKELLTKSKDLVYRYTVYTPQEEMKQILLDDSGLRLDTLRKVFNIDKYKKIKENSQIFVRNIKESKKEYEGRIADLEIKKKDLKEKKKQVKDIEKQVKELMPKLEAARKNLLERKDEIKKTENKIKTLNDLKSKLDLFDLDLKRQLEQHEINKKEIEGLDKDIKKLEEELKDKEIKDLKKDINDKEREIHAMESEIRKLERNLSEFKAIRTTSFQTKKKIEGLDKCPMCEQDVSSEHKKKIDDREEEKLKKIEAHLKKHEEELKLNEKKLAESKEQFKELSKRDGDSKIIKLKMNSLNEKKKKKEKKENNQENIKKNIGKINSEKLKINENMKDFKDVDKNYEVLREKLDEALNSEKKIEIKANGFEKEKDTINRIVQDLDNEINEKLKIKKKITSMKEVQHWFEEYLINLMDVMEKHVMLKIYREFNELFQNWFNILIEDENINVRLDDSFSPVVEQNGYEIEVGNLSGGEKTSCALAYRLALNKVINDFIGDVKTKELIILDEPTDGFSSEQLDKIRDVLEQLNMRQVIVVSHESKIESYVDNVIRINKEEHVSRII